MQLFLHKVKTKWSKFVVYWNKWPEETRPWRFPVFIEVFKYVLALFLAEVLCSIRAIQEPLGRTLYVCTVGVLLVHPCRTIGAQIECTFFGLLGIAFGGCYSMLVFTFTAIYNDKHNVDGTTAAYRSAGPLLLYLFFVLGMWGAAWLKVVREKYVTFCSFFQTVIIYNMTLDIYTHVVPFAPIWLTCSYLAIGVGISQLTNVIVNPKFASTVVRNCVFKCSNATSAVLVQSTEVFMAKADDFDVSKIALVKAKLDKLRIAVRDARSYRHDAENEISYGYFPMRQWKRVISRFVSLEQQLEAINSCLILKEALYTNLHKQTLERSSILRSSDANAQTLFVETLTGVDALAPEARKHRSRNNINLNSTQATPLSSTESLASPVVSFSVTSSLPDTKLQQRKTISSDSPYINSGSFARNIKPNSKMIIDNQLSHQIESDGNIKAFEDFIENTSKHVSNIVAVNSQALIDVGTYVQSYFSKDVSNLHSHTKLLNEQLQCFDKLFFDPQTKLVGDDIQQGEEVFLSYYFIFSLRELTMSLICLVNDVSRLGDSAQKKQLILPAWRKIFVSQKSDFTNFRTYNGSTKRPKSRSSFSVQISKAKNKVFQSAEDVGNGVKGLFQKKDSTSSAPDIIIDSHSAHFEEDTIQKNIGIPMGIIDTSTSLNSDSPLDGHVYSDIDLDDLQHSEYEDGLNVHPINVNTVKMEDKNIDEKDTKSIKDDLPTSKTSDTSPKSDVIHSPFQDSPIISAIKGTPAYLKNFFVAPEVKPNMGHYVSQEKELEQQEQFYKNINQRTVQKGAVPLFHRSNKMPQEDLESKFVTKWRDYAYKFIQTFTTPAAKHGYQMALCTGLIGLLPYIPSSAPFYAKWNGTTMLITIVFVLSPMVGQSTRTGIFRIIGTIVGSFWAYLAFISINENPYFGLFMMTLLSFPAAYFHLYGPYHMVGVIINLSAAPVYFSSMNYVQTSSPFDQAYRRCVMVIMGVGISLFACTFIFPNKATTALRKTLAETVEYTSNLFVQSVFQLLRSKRDTLKWEAHVTRKLRLLHKLVEISRSHLQSVPGEIQITRPFPEKTYTRILDEVQRLVTGTGQLAFASAKGSEVMYEIRFPEAGHQDMRREYVASILLTCHLLTVSLRFKTPLPHHIPSARVARRRFIAAVRHSVKEIGMDITESRFLYWNSFMLGLEEVIESLDYLTELMKSLYGETRYTDLRWDM